MYFLLGREGFDCVLCHAAQVKALPGRPKTDKLDSAWLAKITERGSLPGSFVPPEDIRRLRTHTRYRRHLTQARTAEKARCEKLLEDAHLKLSSVITDIHGVSGRDMLNAIIAGERNPKVLAQMARDPDARQDPPAGRGPRLLVLHRTARLHPPDDAREHRSLTAQISELSAKIEVLCEPYERQIAQLDAIPGWGIITAQDIIAEIGVDMTVFPTAGHLASWARQAPAGRLSPPGSARARTPLAAATPTLAARSARPPSTPAAPRPSWAPSTGGSSGGCPRRKPRAPSAEASSSSPTNCSLTPAPSTRTSAPTTTNSARTSAARSAATPAPSNGEATRVILEPIDPGLDPDILPVTKAS